MPQGYNASNGNRDWAYSVRDNARYIASRHQIAEPGYHTFRVWMVDPGVVLERILIDTPASAKAVSYLGPPESFRGTARWGTRATQTWRTNCNPQGMLHWTLVFLIIAIIAGVLGFAGIAGAAVGLAKICFFIFLAIWLISLIMVRRIT